MRMYVRLHANIRAHQYGIALLIERTLLATCRRSYLGRISSLRILVHLRAYFAYFLPYIVGDFDIFPISRLKIIYGSRRYRTTQHLFQTHRLRNGLHSVAIVQLAASVLIFYGHHRPKTFSATQRNALGRPRKNDGVALPRNAQIGAFDGQRPHNERIASAFDERTIVHALVQNSSLSCQEILTPLTLDVNQRPLSATKREMLNPRQLQIIVFGVTHLRMQVTPAGHSLTITS